MVIQSVLHKEIKIIKTCKIN